MNSNKNITANFVIYLLDIDSGLTSPTGDYRWLDVSNQSYSTTYRNSYNYTQANVSVTYNTQGPGQLLMKTLVLPVDGGKKNGTELHGPMDRTSTTKAMAHHQTQTISSIIQDVTSMTQQAPPAFTINSQGTSYLVTLSPMDKETQ